MYYLTTKGITVLRNYGDSIDASAVRRAHGGLLYKDEFIAHHLSVCQLSLQLSQIYSGTLSFFSSVELMGYEAIPSQSPDGYITIEQEDSVRHYFLEYIDESRALFIILRRLKLYSSQSESSELSGGSSYFPTVIVIAQTGKQLQSMWRKTRYLLSSSGADLHVYGMALENLSDVKSPNELGLFRLDSLGDQQFLFHQV